MILYQAVILAGGLATRLRPITEKIPKALLPIRDKPFIAYQLEKFKKEGIEDVVVCVGYLGKQIEEYVGDGSRFGLRVRFFQDGDSLLGTAGAIRCILDHLDENFFVVYGDSYLPCEFAPVQKTFQESQKKALMTVYHNQGFWDRSNVEFCQGKILKYSKQEITPQMEHIDYGLGLFKKEAFRWLKQGSLADLADLYQTLLHQEQLAGKEISERFYEVGSLSGIEEFKKFQSLKNV